LCQERTKDNAFQTSRLHVQSRTGHSVDKGSADSSGQSHQGKARLIDIQLSGKLVFSLALGVHFKQVLQRDGGISA
jgi:hypothetical protein